MEENIITYETALLAYKKGFIHVKPHIRGDTLAYDKKSLSIINAERGNVVTGYILAPTQSLLQKWIREKANIRIFIMPSAQGIFRYEIYTWSGDNMIGKWNRISHPLSYNTYEEALEKALQEGLELL